MKGRPFVGVDDDVQIRGLRHNLPGFARKELPVPKAKKQVPDGVRNRQIRSPDQKQPVFVRSQHISFALKGPAGGWNVREQISKVCRPADDDAMGLV